MESFHESSVVQLFLLMDESKSLQKPAPNTNRRLSELNRAAASFLVNYLNAIPTQQRYEVGFVQFGSDPENQVLVEPPRPSDDPLVRNFLSQSPLELSYTEFSQAFTVTTSWLNQDIPTIYILFTDGEPNPSPYYGQNVGLSDEELRANDWENLEILFRNVLEPQGARVHTLIQPHDNWDQADIDQVLYDWEKLLADTGVMGGVEQLGADYYSFADLYAEILGPLTTTSFDLTHYDPRPNQPFSITVSSGESARFVFFRQSLDTVITLRNPDDEVQTPAAGSAETDYAVIFNAGHSQPGVWMAEVSGRVRLYLYKLPPQAKVLAPDRAVSMNEPLHVVARTGSGLLSVSPIWDAVLTGPNGVEHSFTVSRPTAGPGSDETFVYEAWLEPSLLTEEGRYRLTLTSRSMPGSVAATYSFCAHPIPKLSGLTIQQAPAVTRRAEVTVSVQTDSFPKAPGLTPQITILREGGQIVAGPLGAVLNPRVQGLYMTQFDLGVGEYRVRVNLPSGRTSDGIVYPGAGMQDSLSIVPVELIQTGSFDVSPREVEVGKPISVSLQVRELVPLQEVNAMIMVFAANGRLVRKIHLSGRKDEDVFTETLVLDQVGGYRIEALVKGRTSYDELPIEPISLDFGVVYVKPHPSLVAPVLAGGLGVLFVILLLVIGWGSAGYKRWKSTEDDKNKILGRLSKSDDDIARAGAQPLIEAGKQLSDARSLQEKERGIEIIENKLESALSNAIKADKSAYTVTEDILSLKLNLYEDNLDEQRNIIYEQASQEATQAQIKGLAHVLSKRWINKPDIMLEEYYELLSKPKGIDVMKVMKVLADLDNGEEKKSELKELREFVVQMAKLACQLDQKVRSSI